MNKIDRSSRRFNIALSLLIAISLWFYVINVENPSGETSIPAIPVAVQGVDILADQGLLVTDLSRDTVTLKAVGKRKTFLKLYKSDLALSVDVSTITGPGEYMLTGKVTPDYLRTDSSVTLSEKDSFAITVTVKKKASREIPVVGEFHGTLAAGYDRDPIQTNPAKIEVSGPEDVMASIEKAVVVLNGESVKETLRVQESFVLLDKAGEVVKEENLTCSTELVEATLPVMKLYEVPLTVELRPGGGADAEDAELTIAPASIKLTGSDEALAQLTSISLGEIDLAEVFSSKSKVFSIPLPEGAKSRSGETEATVTLSLDLPMKSISTNQITIANAPRGYQVSLVGDSLQVWVRGEQSVLDQVTGEHLRVVVDLANVPKKRGQQRAEASVTLDGMSGVGVVGADYTVAIHMKAG